MGDGGLRATPFGAIEQLVGYLVNPAVWAELDGECTAAGVDIRYVSFDRLLNLTYRWLTLRLEPDKEGSVRDARTRLDSDLGVRMWSRIAIGRRDYGIVEPDAAPAWWFGDEDASQSFLTAMGVVLE
jgi:hypothetical protein